MRALGRPAGRAGAAGRAVRGRPGGDRAAGGVAAGDRAARRAGRRRGLFGVADAPGAAAGADGGGVPRRARRRGAPASAGRGAAGAGPAGAGLRRLRRRAGQGAAPAPAPCFCVVPADPGLSWAETRAQLTARCDALAEGLGRLGMPAERLTHGRPGRPRGARAGAPARRGPGPLGRRRPPAGRGGGARSAAPLGRPRGVLAGLFRDGAGGPHPGGATGAAGAGGRGSWCGHWCPARCARRGWRPGWSAGPAIPRSWPCCRGGDLGAGWPRPSGRGVQGRGGAGGRRRRGPVPRARWALTACAAHDPPGWLTPLVTLDARWTSRSTSPRGGARVRALAGAPADPPPGDPERAAEEGASPTPTS